MMILYHYSVDSYKSGDTLYNDFKGLYRFAEPFLLALEKGENCFWSTYFSAMAYSRELCALGLRKNENYIKDATEGIFEYIRRREFPENSVSRIGCVYYCESREEAISYLKDADVMQHGLYNPLCEIRPQEKTRFNALTTEFGLSELQQFGCA